MPGDLSEIQEPQAASLREHAVVPVVADDDVRRRTAASSGRTFELYHAPVAHFHPDPSVGVDTQIGAVGVEEGRRVVPNVYAPTEAADPAGGEGEAAGGNGLDSD